MIDSNFDTKKGKKRGSYEVKENSRDGFQEMKLNCKPKDVPNPEDFPLGSLESRAAARLRLKRWIDTRKWITLCPCDPKPREDPSRMNFGPWNELPDGDLMRMVYIPSAWRILPSGQAKVAHNHVPSCSECGVAFTEEGRHGTLVRFLASCLDRHDPSPPPTRTHPVPMSENRLSEVDIKTAHQVCVKMCAYELEDVLADRLEMHPGHLREFISGEREEDAALRVRIAAELEAVF